MKSFIAAAAVSAIAGTASAQQTFTGFGASPAVSGNILFQNQTLFQVANQNPNVTKSVSITAGTTPSETWSWAVNVSDVINSSQDQTINTVISLTWPQQTTANSVCAIAINGNPLTYKTNPGSDGSCADVLSGCIDDLSTALSKGLVSSDGTAQCGTAFTNISVPTSCSSYFTVGSGGLNVSASPMGNLQSGQAWLYSANYGASPSLNDSATRVWPLFLMHTAGSNITTFANPVCLQAEASKSATATSSSTATGSSATATSTKKSAAPQFTSHAGLLLSAFGMALMMMMI